MGHLGIGRDRPLTHNLSLFDREAVATSSLFFAAGIVSLQFVSTIPPKRRQGIGTAIASPNQW
jgi:hypothetical protein